MVDYDWYKSNGICVQCLQYDASPGKVRCEVCLAKNAEGARRYRAKMQSVSRAEKSRKLRESRKEQGLCIWCGKPRSNYSSVFCPDCRIKNQHKNDARKGISRSERPAYGMCYRCGKAVVFGEKLCQPCKMQSISNLPEKPNVIKSWRIDNNRVFSKSK